MLRIPIKIMALVVCVFPVVLQGSQAPTAGPPTPQPQAAAKSPSMASNTMNPVHPTPESPSMASNTMNPVHPTPESQAHAKKIYAYDCVMCHGANGDGKGDMNTDGKIKVPDLRDPATGVSQRTLRMVIFTTLLKSAASGHARYAPGGRSR